MKFGRNDLYARVHSHAFFEVTLNVLSCSRCHLGASLMPQRFYRVHACRAPCRKIAKQYADPRRE